MRRETQNVLLVLLGGALLKISFTGTYLRYVKPAHQWLLILAGVVMLVLAAVSIARDLTGRDQADRACDPAPDHAGEHAHGSRSAWLLALPVLALFLVAPPALGADSVQRAAQSVPRATLSDDGMELFPPLPEDEVVALQLSEFVERAAWDSGGSLDDRRVRLTGFVVHERGVSYVARIAISCCAADAYPVKVRIEGADLTRHPDDSWVEAVVGLMPGTATKANDYVPSASLHTIRPITAPEDPYEH